MWQRGPGILSLLMLALLVVPGEAQQAKGKKYALLVGVTDYSHASLLPLRFTENDVEVLAKLLTQPGAGFADVRVLTTTRGKTNAADAPTGANIKKALGELIANKTRQDMVLIALSGHGVTLEVEDPDGKAENKSYVYFCPADADLVGVSYRTGTSKTLLNLNGLFGSLGRSGAGTKLVLVDACRNELKAESATRSIDPKQVTIPNGVGALFSCKAGQRAHEVASLKHGVFFYHVLEGLRGGAKTEDGEVTWDSLGAYVRRVVPREVPKVVGGGAKQTPHAMTNIEGEPPVLLKLNKAVVGGPGKGKKKSKEPTAPESPASPKAVPGQLPSVKVATTTYRGMAGGGIEKVDEKGNPIWKVTRSGPRNGGEPRAVAVVQKSALLYQGSTLACFDALTGKELWMTAQVPLAANASVTMKEFGNDGVELTDGRTTIFYDLRNGKLIRRIDRDD